MAVNRESTPPSLAFHPARFRMMSEERLLHSRNSRKLIQFCKLRCGKTLIFCIDILPAQSASRAL